MGPQKHLPQLNLPHLSPQQLSLQQLNLQQLNLQPPKKLLLLDQIRQMIVILMDKNCHSPAIATTTMSALGMKMESSLFKYFLVAMIGSMIQTQGPAHGPKKQQMTFVTINSTSIIFSLIFGLS